MKCLKNGSAVFINQDLVLTENHYNFPKGTEFEIKHYDRELDQDGYLLESAVLVRVETCDGIVIHLFRDQIEEAAQ